jgi:hypothetical protein
VLDSLVNCEHQKTAANHGARSHLFLMENKLADRNGDKNGVERGTERGSTAQPNAAWHPTRILRPFQR